jgi:hypothetical protein
MHGVLLRKKEEAAGGDKALHGVRRPAMMRRKDGVCSHTRLTLTLVILIHERFVWQVNVTLINSSSSLNSGTSLLKKLTR